MVNWFINIHWYFRHGCKKGDILLTVLETVHLMCQSISEKEELRRVSYCSEVLNQSQVHPHKQIYDYGRRRKTWWMILCLCRVFRHVNRIQPGGEAELADGNSLTLHTWDRDRAGRQRGHSWSLPSFGCWGTTVPLPSPCLSQGTAAELWVLMLFMLPAAFYDSGEALPDEGINHALGINNYSWLPCYTILELLGRMARLKMFSGFHKAFYFQSTHSWLIWWIFCRDRK